MSVAVTLNVVLHMSKILKTIVGYTLVQKVFL